MPSPLCTVKDGSNAAVAVPPVATVTPGNTVTIALADATGVSTWSLSCIYADETTAVADINATTAVNGATKSATFTAPQAGKALIFQSIVNGGVNASQVPDATLTTTFKVATLTTMGTYVVCSNETNEHGSQGWLPVLNTASRYAQNVPLNTQTSTSVTLSDANHLQTMVLTNASTITATLSAGAKAGTSIDVVQGGAGRITFAAGSGATLSNRQGFSKTSAQYAVTSLYVISNTTGSSAAWVLSGDTAA